MAPDLWFNSVDGILAGVQFRGEDPRTFLDGPHRLRASLRLGTRIPDYPVSYYLSYTHPIAAITDVNSEGALRVVTRLRTGMQQHKVGIQKRWQPGFDEFVATELHISTGFYQRLDKDYLLYDHLWQEDAVFYLHNYLRRRDRNALGRWTLILRTMSGFPISPDSDFIDYSGRVTSHPELFDKKGMFGQVDMQVLQKMELPGKFYFRTRLFGGISSNATPPEQRYMDSHTAAFNWMDSPLTRARGTIPENWIRSGWIHVPGGPGLRGYSYRTIDVLEDSGPVWSQHAVSLNVDFYYPNPVNNLLSNVAYLSDLLKLESYLFWDAGYVMEASVWQDLRMNAGAGFMLSLNIPDYLGRDRGFFIRYELPVWLSEVDDNQENVSLRHLLGLGALIRL